MIAASAHRQNTDYLGDFERAVYDRNGPAHDAAVSQLHVILANRERIGGDVEASRRTHFYFRLASAIAALLLDKTFELTLDQYRVLSASHQSLATVFACTPYQNADYIICQLADISDIDNIRFADTNVLMKCLLCYSLDSRFDLDVGALSDRFPEIVASLVLGHLGYDLYSRPSIETRINRILARPWPVLAGVTPNLPMVVTTSNAWMGCSYATLPGKHEIKRDLNAMIRNGIAARHLNIETTTRERDKQRPTLIVPVELFNSKHAMFRCFSRAVNKLREHFQVIGIAPDNCIDEEAEAVFDRVHRFSAAEVIVDLQPLLDTIHRLAPDIIYYPSLGMANYSLLLANMRLAPIQCFTLGHPASSFIDTMDYVIVQQQDFTTDKVYSERVVLTGNDTSPTINRVREHISEPAIRTHADSIQIAVTSKHMKINHSFLACCREIADAAERPVAFHFFPGVSGYSYEFVRHEILRMLPNSTVYPTTDYDTYIHNMDRCDIRLGTFPFGGANTNMDCFGLGIPFVILDGEQPHSHADTAQLQQSGLPDWLVADSIDAYKTAALRLINDDAERVDISRQMLSLHDNRFFFHTDDDSHMLFDKTMAWIYHHHERMQQSDKRVWTLADQGLELR